MKYLIAITILLAPLGACADREKPTPSEQVAPTEPRDCDQPSRDDQGRPIPLC